MVASCRGWLLWIVLLLVANGWAKGFSAKGKAATATATATGTLTKGGADSKAWTNAYFNCTKEVPPTYLDMELPSDFSPGTYYLNGGGRYFSSDGISVMHPFDADGLMNAITFDPKHQRVLFRNRFVRTKKFRKDRQAGGKMSSRGFFGTLRSGGWLSNLFQLKPENLGNTNAILTKDAKTLYAFWEAGLPHTLDPLTLETRGETNMDGVLDGGFAFSAHPRYDPNTDTYVNFGLGQPESNGNTLMKIAEFRAESFQPVNKGRVFSMPGVLLVHDFVLTERYCVLVWVRASVSIPGVMQAMLGLAPTSALIQVEEQDQVSVVVIPRSLFASSSEEVIDVENDPRISIIPVPSFFGFHHGNGYEDPETGHLVFDVIQSFQDPHTFDFGVGLMQETKQPIMACLNWDEFPASRLYSYVVDVENRKLLDSRLISFQNVDFAVLPKERSTKKARYYYALGSHAQQDCLETSVSSPHGSIIKMDLETGNHESFAFEPFEFVAEPAIVPKDSPGHEDKCYLVAIVTNGRDRTSQVVVFDAEGEGNLSKGPISRRTLPTGLPLGWTHGNFYRDVLFSTDEKTRTK